MRRKRKEAAKFKFRRAATLVASLEDGKIVLHNFLTRDRFACPAEYLEFLAKLDEWTKPEELFRCFPDMDPMHLAGQIPKLVEAKVLLVKGTPEAELDETYRREWLWGEVAGFFHFSVRDTRFVTGKPARAIMRKLKARRASPRLFQPNTSGRVVKLPKADVGAEPLALMRRRRSRRQFDGEPISTQALADCLFAGNGIVEFRHHQGFGRLPITMTPSGGARNPFELYVYAQRVEGLKPGFYHYGALKHDLGLVHAGSVDIPEMLGTQRWTAKSAAIVFLVAHFPRTMWKYHLPMAYRVVAMEAGFIGQNIALAATHHKLSAVPSGALKDTLIENYLDLPAVESAVLLSLTIGRPNDQGD